MKFEQLANSITEQSEFQINKAGQQLLQQYYELIRNIEDKLEEVIQPFVLDPINSKKELAVMVVSTINSNRQGNPQFEVMSRLDTLTNGGQSNIDPSTFSFNPKDPILNYLEEM